MCESLAGPSGVCLEVQSDPDVSALLRRMNGELVDYYDSHTHKHTHIYSQETTSGLSL